MREYREVRRQTEDPEAAAPHLGYARKLLGQMKGEMAISGLQQLTRTKRLEDGTIVTVQSRFGEDTVNIAHPKRVVPITPNVEPDVRIRQDPVVIEPVARFGIETSIPERPQIDPPERPYREPIDIFGGVEPTVFDDEDGTVEVPTGEEYAPPNPPEQADDRKKPGEYFTYEKSTVCALARDSQATSGVTYWVGAFMYMTAQMYDTRSVFLVEAVWDGVPGVLHTLDGDSMQTVRSMTISDISETVALSTASITPPRVIIYGKSLDILTVNLRSINMDTGLATALDIPVSTPTYTPVVPNQAAGSNGVVLGYRGGANIVELLSASSLATIASTEGEATPTAGFGAAVLNISESYFVENDVWAIWHHTLGYIEVKNLTGGPSFTLAVPVAAPVGFESVTAYVAVMRDKKTVWVYFDGDIRRNRDGVWSDNLLPTGATPGFAMLYDPITDTIALSPHEFFPGVGSLAWFFGAKDCKGEPIGVFSHDVSVGGVAPTSSDQFLGGALLTEIHSTAPVAERPTPSATKSRRITKHNIGRLQQTRMDTFERVSADGERVQISEAEYTAGGGI